MQACPQPAKIRRDSNLHVIMIDIVTGEALVTWMCLTCGWIYDEAAGDAKEGLAPGTRWADVPPNWTCPECNSRKDDFEMIKI